MPHHAGRTAHILPGPDRPSSARYPPPRVLLIDAHADTRELYELWLSERAFAVTTAVSGSDGLAAARQVAPDVVVVELMVPDGGVPLVRALRSEAGCGDCVVIVLTTQTGATLRRQALEAGADFYLVKPCGILRVGDVMAIASRHRFRLVAPGPDGAPSTPRLREAVRRSRAIRERLAANPPAPPAGSSGRL